MQVQLKALGLALTDGLAEFCRDRIVEPVTRRYDRGGARLELELSDDNGPKGGLDKRCRLSFSMPFTKTLTVTEEAADIYTAVDRAAQRLQRLVARYKGRKLDGPRRPRKYFVAAIANDQKHKTASPEDVTIEEDSLAAVEERDRRERLEEAARQQGEPG